MKITPKEYSDLTDKISPSSPIYKNCAFAFISGGLICTLGQFLCEMYQQMGLSLSEARCSTTLSLVFLSAAVTSLGLFDNIARFCGAGTLVPITGFANAMVSTAMEFKSEGIITGTCTKMFSIAGPVLVFGISASVVYGLVLFIVRLFYPA